MKPLLLISIVTLFALDVNATARIALTGVVASGKGTQSEKLQKYYKIPYFGFGEIIREEAKKDTTLGKAIQDSGIKSKTTPIWVVDEIVKKTIAKAENGFIWDDRLYAFEYFYNLFNEKNWDVKVIFLDARPEIQHQRANHRYWCATECKVSNFTKRGCNTCDKTEVVRNEDNKEKEFEARITKERQDIESVLNFWKNKPNFKYIDTSNMTKEEVFTEIKNFVGEQNELKVGESGEAKSDL